MARMITPPDATEMRFCFVAMFPSSFELRAANELPKTSTSESFVRASFSAEGHCPESVFARPEVSPSSDVSLPVGRKPVAGDSRSCEHTDQLRAETALSGTRRSPFPPLVNARGTLRRRAFEARRVSQNGYLLAEAAICSLGDYRPVRRYAWGACTKRRSNARMKLEVCS